MPPRTKGWAGDTAVNVPDGWESSTWDLAQTWHAPAPFYVVAAAPLSRQVSPPQGMVAHRTTGTPTATKDRHEAALQEANCQAGERAGEEWVRTTATPPIPLPLVPLLYSYSPVVPYPDAFHHPLPPSPVAATYDDGTSQVLIKRVEPSTNFSLQTGASLARRTPRSADRHTQGGAPASQIGRDLRRQAAPKTARGVSRLQPTELWLHQSQKSLHASWSQKTWSQTWLPRRNPPAHEAISTPRPALARYLV